jgi:DNA gyrase subunit A
MLSRDGKGTVRLMSGFSANKAPGSGGKVAMRTEELAGIAAVGMDAGDDEDIFIISELGKIIRIRASEVPPKEGVVQGVSCMNLRNDRCAAIAVTTMT